jgi:hypothetical protein
MLDARSVLGTDRHYVDRLRDVLDKWLFFVFFVVGALSIFVLKHLGVDQWTITAVPVCLIGLYAIAGYFSRSFRLREDRIGDNLYYLGFLYTLVSLAYSLYIFGDGAGTDAIISNFGIALLTTITGLALRVVFNQLREDTTEMEREVRQELIDAVRQLKSSLYSSVEEFDSFRRALQQSLRDGYTDVGKQTTEALEGNTKRFSEIADQVVGGLQRAFGEFGEHSRRLATAADNTVSGVEALVQRIEQIEAPRELVAQKIEPAVAGILEIVRLLSERSQKEGQQLKKLQKLVEDMNEASEQLKQNFIALNAGGVEQREALSRETERLKAMVDSVGGAAAGYFQTVQQGAAQQAQVLAQLVKAAETNTALTSEQQRALQSQVQRSQELIAALDRLEQSAGRSGAALEQSATQHASAIERLSTATEAAIRLSREHTAALTSELEATRAVQRSVTINGSYGASSVPRPGFAVDAPPVATAQSSAPAASDAAASAPTVLPPARAPQSGWWPWDRRS